MKVRFIADLHFDHKNIAKFSGPHRGNTKNSEEHDEWIIEQWNSIVNKNDLTWVLGDVSFTREGIKKVKRLNGVKHLILGNHDTFALKHYLEVFNKVHGFMKYKGFWLSHAPVREESLRGKINIHGHTHSPCLYDVKEWRDYICVSVEALNGKPIEFNKILERV